MILALKKTLGLDRAILYVLLNRGWTLLAGFVTLYLISATMSKAEQGYYYTFSSILALQIFFELGFSGIIAQFASHEMAKLHWRGGDIAGDPPSRQRLLSLFRLAIKWYGVISLLTVFLLNTAGYYFFSSAARQGDAVNWHLPWILLTLGATLNLFLSPLLALFEGSGLVANVSALRLMQSMVAYGSGWLLLLNGGKLYTAAAISIMTAVVGFCWLGKHYGAFLNSLRQNPPATGATGVCWRREIWPMQWRIALSWLSGYFISQLFTPLVFRYQGTEAAGQLGMSLSIVTTMSTVASAWLTTKLPSFGMLIADRQPRQLMALFRKSSLQSIAVLLAQHGLFFILLLAMRRYQLAFSSRLLEPIDILWLLLAAQASHIVFLQAAYIRAHKIEPYLKHAILLAVLISSSSYYLIQHYSIREMLALYAIICGTVGVGYSSYIYAGFNKRKMTGQ